jgi:uncharacterized repeat protein (TIGR03837 family)
MIIDILCRVVDNFGDIGFVYRLARAMSELSDPPRLRLIVDDLAAFGQLCPLIRPDRALQEVDNVMVVRWSDPGESALRLFVQERPRFVLECYACGRPDWFEAILFDPGDTIPRHIINLEYLTAESWARDFHLLPSMTRSPLVKKTVFMPGFEPGTGGLLQDISFCSLLDACADPERRLSVRQSAVSALVGTELISGTELASGRPPSPDKLTSAFWFLVFSYEHDFTTMIADLAAFNGELSARASGQPSSAYPLVVLVAEGRSSGPFLDAWNRADRPFPVLALPFLEQSLWDRFLVSSDFAVIRGEESFSRAALTGRPFLWQCYPFGDGAGDRADHGGQLPKVRAFLDLIRQTVLPAAFAPYERLMLAFNRAAPYEAGTGIAFDQPQRFEPAPGELLSVLRALSPESDSSLRAGFAACSRKVRNLGNLASNLVTFMRDLG